MAIESPRLTTVLDQIRPLVIPLSAAEQLALVQTIASIEPKPKPASSPPAQQRSQLAAEQSAWYARPSDERERYRGEFVAVRGGQVVDHDLDRRALYLRVRARFGRTPVPILHADWDQPPTYTIHSPRLER